MRSLLLTGLILSVCLGVAQAKGELQIRLECSEPKGSAYVLYEGSDQFLLGVNHSGGKDSIPIYSGDVYAGDIQYLKEKGKIFRKIGSSYQIAFEKKNCQQQPKGSWHCFVSNPIQINQAQVDSLSFYYYPQDVNSAESSFTRHNVGLEVRIDSQIYDSTKSYFDSDCQ